MCSRCNRGREDIVHALRDCNEAKQVWEFIIVPTEFMEFQRLGNNEWLRESARATFRNIILPDTPWFFVFLATLWSIWKERNLWIFQVKRFRLRVRINRIKVLASDFCQAWNEMAKGRQIQIVNRHWSKPPDGWYKLNTDGSVFSHTGSAAFGGLLRDDRGEWIVGFAKCIGQSSITVAELMGFREGLRIAWERRITRLQIEIDSEVVVRLIEEAETSAHPLGNIIDDVRYLLRRPWKSCLRHVSRECNSCADGLARKGHGLQELSTWLEPPPGWRIWF